MAQFEQHFVQDLTQPIKVRHCGSIVFNADNESNVISVRLFNGSEPVAISGSVVGAVVCSDGSTVTLSGSYSGNTASITLTGDCFAVLGQIGVGIQIVNGTQKTTVLKVIYNVETLTTENVVDPGSRITLEVGDLINDIETATAAIPASDMASLMSGIAPTFSDSVAYKAGAYVYYSGNLYCFTADHNGGTWTGSDVTAAVLCNDVSDLKSATVDNTERFLPEQNSLNNTLNNTTVNYYNPATVTDGVRLRVSDLQLLNNASFAYTDLIPVLPGDTVTFNATLGSSTYGTGFYNSSRVLTSALTSQNSNNPFVVPNGIFWIATTITIASKQTFEVYISHPSDVSVKTYIDSGDIETAELKVQEEQVVLYTTEDTPNGNSITTVGTFWLTSANTDILPATGKELKSITLVANNTGTLTIRGYNLGIDGTLPWDVLKNIAIDANANAYDIATLTLTQGESTYLFDGTDSRVEIVGSLICPPTLGLFKNGDTGIFKYKTASALSDVAYFIHASYDSSTKTAAKLYIGLGITADALALSLVKKNGNEINTSALIDNIRGVSSLAGKRISFLADSITTFQGYNPSGYAYWYPQGDITNVKQTWWKQLLDETGLILGVNASWSGSTVTGDSTSTTNAAAGCSTARINALSANGTPDIIVIFMGINDFGLNNRRAVGDWIGESAIPAEGTKTIFSEAYALMMKKVMSAYPSAKVYACTLMETTKTNYDQDGAAQDFPTTNTNGTVLKQYNDRIVTIAKAVGARVIEIHECGIHHWNTDLYTTDGIHPNAAGAILVKNAVKSKLLSDFK